mgnify:CR=1 FL=1
MKHLKAKGILAAVLIAVLMLGLAAVYNQIGVHADLDYARQHCAQKAEGLTASVGNLITSYANIFYSYEKVLKTNAAMAAFPLEQTVSQMGDAAIGMYIDGCVVRLDGDRLILPTDTTMPVLEVSDFLDENDNPLPYGSIYTEYSREQGMQNDDQLDLDPLSLVGYFIRLSDDYYYVDFTGLSSLMSFVDAHGTLSDALLKLEEIYGGTIVTFLADDPDGYLAYVSSASEGKYNTIRDLGIDPNSSGEIISLDGVSCVYALSAVFVDPSSEERVSLRVAYVMPIDSMARRRTPQIILTLCVSLLFFISTACLLLSGMGMFRRRAITQQQRGQYGPERMRRMAIALGLAGTLCVGLLTFFVSCLIHLYSATENNERLMESFHSISVESLKNDELIEKEQNETYVNYARRIADLLMQFPELQTPDSLGQICSLVGADYVMLFDDQGRETLTNAPYVNLTLGGSASSEDFRLLLLGVPSVVHETQTDEQTLLTRQLIGVSVYDDDISNGYGALILAMMPDTDSEDQLSAEMLMEDMIPADNMFLALDSSSGTILLATEPNLVNENALALGMTERNLYGGIMDHFALNGQRWYSSSDTLDGLVYHAATRAEAVFRGMPTTALLFGLSFLIAYAVLALVLLYGFTNRSIEENGPQVVEDKDALRHLEPDTPFHATKRLGVILERLRTRYIDRTPEQRTRFVFCCAAFVMLVGILAVFLSISSSGDEMNIFYYVLNGKWTPGINLFACARILILSLGLALGLLFLQLVTDIACALMQKRGETIVRLLSSFVQYVGVLALLFSACDSLGFDTRALLASVGIVSLAVSLGARDLVADVLSGVMLAFSDEYQIDEYVEIGGFRGWVQDIGIRSTTLVNNEGNIKIYNNRDVKNVLNLSRRNCKYTISVTIANDQPLKKVEDILNRELIKVGKETPEIIKGPAYTGVSGFSAGSVTLTISAECKEHNYGKVRRQVNRAVRLILEDNGITIR